MILGEINTMKNEFPHLFTTGHIGKLEIKNRVVMPAMCAGLANEDGTVSDDLIKYYEIRAKGGAGLIITEFTMVNGTNGRHNIYQLGAYDDKQIAGLKKLAARIHKYDTKVFVQLCHPGSQAFKSISEGEALTPSGIGSEILKNPCRPMTVEEIHQITKEFAEAAERVKKAGIDGIEINAGHGYLLNEFMSPYYNRREDEYGGSLINRCRLIKEILEAVRAKVGKDYPLIFRMSVKEYLETRGIREQGLTLADSIAMLNYLIPYGIDAVSVTSGVYDTENTVCEPIPFPQGWRANLSETVKQNVPKPVIGVSVIREPSFAESLLERNALDFVGVGRGQLADPEWAIKAKTGRAKEIRRCISCLHCMETLAKTGRTECAINPRSNHELDYGDIKKTAHGEPVVVVGGGPAGMECARMLTLRGYHAILFEKSDRLGGQLRVADLPPFKKKLDWLISYYEERLKVLKVDVRLNTEATADIIKAEKPVKVFLSTGSEPNMPESIVGIHGDNVYRATDILTGKKQLIGKQVIVVGDGQTGIETADFLCGYENVVSIVGRGNSIGEKIYFQNRDVVLNRVRLQHGRLFPRRSLIAINPEGITVESTITKELSFMPADAVVLALGVHPTLKGREEILKAYPDAVLLGDAIHGGRIADAVHTAYDAVDALE